MKFDKIKFIEKTTSFPQRQLKDEIATAKEVIKVLKKRGVDFELQKYKNHIPVEVESSLVADGKIIKCQNNGFVSGEIKNNHNLASSLSDFDAEGPNINFNPECVGISLASFYNAPSLAIASVDVDRLIKAKKISGVTKVRKIQHESVNIIIGNKKTPENIYFTHLDSINKGAIDNASGVATLLDVIVSFPEITKKNLFVFCGSEELSYEWPVYWGYGYRIFERRNITLLKRAKRIIVVDGVGHSKLETIKDTYWMLQAFPLKHFNAFISKITILAGSIDKLMPVYHSDLDDIGLLNQKFLEEVKYTIMKEAIF